MNWRPPKEIWEKQRREKAYELLSNYDFYEAGASAGMEALLGEIDELHTKYFYYQGVEGKKMEGLMNDELFKAIESVKPFSQFIREQLEVKP